MYQFNGGTKAATLELSIQTSHGPPTIGFVALGFSSNTELSPMKPDLSVEVGVVFGSISDVSVGAPQQPDAHTPLVSFGLS